MGDRKSDPPVTENIVAGEHETERPTHWYPPTFRMHLNSGPTGIVLQSTAARHACPSIMKIIETSMDARLALPIPFALNAARRETRCATPSKGVVDNSIGHRKESSQVCTFYREALAVAPAIQQNRVTRLRDSTALLIESEIRLVNGEESTIV